MIKISLPKKQAKHYWLGFSGGVDSLALLLLVKDLLPKHALTAVHFQHGLRGEEAERDAEWCRQVCLRLKIHFLRIDLAVQENKREGESLEEAARRERLQQWQQLATIDDMVFLGHHQDDVLEEFFLRAARGSNSSGLTSLRAERQIGNVYFCRPLLPFRKQALRDFVSQAGFVSWCEDRTNLQNEMRRNAVRNQLLPLFRQIFGQDTGLQISIENLQKDACFLEKQAQQIAVSLTGVKELRQVDMALFPRVIRYWLRQQTGQDILLNKNEIERLWQVVQQAPQEPIKVILQKGQVVLRFLLNEMRVVTEGTTLSERIWDWEKNPTLSLPEIQASLRAEVVEYSPDIDLTEKGTGFFAYEPFPKEILIRPRRAGDVIQPLGRDKVVKVKKILIEKNIPSEKRSEIPILEGEQQLLWIPGVKRSHWFLVEPYYKVLKISFCKWEK